MAHFADLVTILRALKNRTYSSGIVTGGFLVETPEQLAAIKACADDFANTTLNILHPSEEVEIDIGTEVLLEIATPRPGFGLIYENMAALLCYPGAHVKEPKNFYLLDSDFAKEGTPLARSIIDRYHAVLSFVSMLKRCAAFLDEREELLVFIKDGKFEVPIKYTSNDLVAIEAQLLTDLCQIITLGIHEKQQLSIMAEAIYEITVKHPADKRFVALLENASDLKDRFEKGYTLFAAGFSYEKIRDEIETARIEYSGKIHKVFSDIQNQLLGIPIATIIVATQMKESSDVDGRFWTSVAVLIGSFVFMILMHFLLRNQKHTLDVVGIEINRQKTMLEKQHAAIAPNFSKTFSALDSRYKGQRTILMVIDWVVILGFLISVFFFYELNMPVQKWVANFCI